MRELNLTIVAIIILLFSGTASSDGNRLLSGCNAAINFMDNSQALSNNDEILAGFCFGMLHGMTILNKIYEIELNNKALFCTPNGINNGQVARIIVKYLKDHPEMLHENDSILVLRALQEAYPCN